MNDQKNEIGSLYLIEISIVAVLLLATIVINLRMIRDGINGMTDLKWHITWLQHFSKQLAEGIWYPRWLAGTNYGYGSPTFVFYPPLVYYLGSLLKFVGFNIEQTIVILFSLALFLSGLNFYIFGRDRWGNMPSLVGALAYMSAPYIAFNLYWVSSISVAFGIALIPLGWYVTDKALDRPKWRVGVALFWTILALTHLPTLLLCAIIWLFYTLFFLLDRPWKNIISTLIFAGIGLGIASFFLLPAILEQPLIDIEFMKEVIGEIKNGMFGGGLPLIPSHFDLSLSHVFFQQSLAIIVLTIIAFSFSIQDKLLIQEIGKWFAFTLVLAFLMSHLSLPIWQDSETLQKVQAPFRLLNLFSFAGASLCAVATYVIIKWRSRFQYFFLLIIIGILLLNTSYSYKLSRQFPTINKPGRANLESLEAVKKALYQPYTDELIDVGEYRPVIKKGIPSPDPAIGRPKISLVNGQADIKIENWGSYQRNFQITTAATSTLRIRTYYYPAWYLYVNKKSYPINISDEGTIEFTLKPGSYHVELVYQWTKAFTLGIALSILSLLLLVILNGHFAGRLTN
jgi:uncharacterized membrane protein